MPQRLSASFLLVLLGVSLWSAAQNPTELRIGQVLRWNDPGQRSGVPGASGAAFEGALDLSGNGLPWFSYRTSLREDQSILAYRITAEEVSFLPQNLAGAWAGEDIGSDWTIRARVTDGGGDPYLVVDVLPVRQRNGRMERLDRFEIILDMGPRSSGNSRSADFAEHSVLAEGSWYKIAIARDGIYRIDRNLLNQLGIDGSVNPQQINLYGNGGSLLPADNSTERPDDLVKNPIFIQGEGDGSFDAGDFILFYGKGPDTWTKQYDTNTDRYRWVQTKHYYSDSAYYFLRVDDADPLRIGQAPVPSGDAVATSTSFQDFQYIENDLYNLVKSGREFYGDEFDITTSASYSFSFPNILPVPGTLDIGAVSRSIGTASNFSFTVQGSSGVLNTSAVSDFPTSAAGDFERTSLSFNPSSSTFPVAITYNKSNPDAKGWLDYLTINVSRNLVMAGNQMKFRDTLSTGAGIIAQFQLSGATANLSVWDITDPLAPQQVPLVLNGSVAEWKTDHSTLREYIAFSNTGFLVPTPKGRVENQDLHALNDVDLMIISAPRHFASAQALAELHAAEGMVTAVVTPMQVFNEFSSGNPDVTAFRWMMKMLYDRANGEEALLPKNLLLFGDGSYLDNKGLEAQTGYNVMVFESDNSLSPTASYVSDDYFVMLSDDDDASPTNALDCGVGRIPATNVKEGEDYVAKVRSYIASNTSDNGAAFCLGDEAQSPYGSWRNLLVFVSDDQDGNGDPFEQVHLNNSDSLTSIVAANHPEYDVVKIYMDAYTQETTPGGERYPEAEEAIRQRVQNGALLVTYIGHGGERGWAHERVLDIPTIQNWTNRNRLPVFLTATCELARYDDPSYNSAGEILVMNPDGGAIAMLTTTRIVFSGENFQMDLAFFEHALDEDAIEDLTLGKLNMLTKNNVSAGNDSKPNFSLLGDPALKMSYPQRNVYTSHINGIEIAAFQDTLKALQEVEFRGYVGDGEGNPLSGFNGFVYPVVYDKETKVLTQNNDGGQVQEYDTFNKIIYRGKSSVTNGEFTFRFVVPYDINYNVDGGRVSYYAVSGDVDAHGYRQDFRIGSSLDGAQLNTVGPEVEVYMNDTTFVSGGLTNTEPLLVVRLKDENGINTVGNGIGHDLSAILDGNTQDPIILNDYYEADLDTYQSGEVRYQMNDLAPGDHQVRVKAWDVHNNSSENTLEFTVAEDAGIALEHVLNYPNPFTTYTEFFFEHNQACEFLDVRIQVFTVSGKLVKTLDQRVHQDGFRSQPIAWDGTDDFGDRIGKGVYVYKVEVRNEVGQRAEKFEKLVILK